MRTMFAVGHRNRTHTRIVIKRRLREDRRADEPRRERPVASAAARRERPVASNAPRRETSAAVPARTTVH